ncbi:MAG: ABC transporter permease [Candidatus Krumholzibacteria bacterium]|nr:ABC transporter permease [Candidatus Krumholzibacteria bacterium]
MFKTCLLIVVRNLKKHRTFSIINILGLAVGMACVLMIGAYIRSELGYDRHHEKAARIFRLEAVLTLGDQANPIASTNFPPTLAMRNDFPEVENSVRFVPRRKVLVESEGKKFYEEKIYYAEETVFDIFTFPMLRGNPAGALARANTVVITQGMSEKYYGGDNPVGRTLKLNGTDEFEVTGVIADVPANSHFRFDALLSFRTFLERNRETVESWSSYFGSYGYVLLAGGADYRELEKKLPAMKEKYIGDSFREAGADVEYSLTPLADIHLHSHKRHEIEPNGDIMYVYIFGVVALFILAMACINFMNLSTARSSTRAREIGVRKVLGAGRRQVAAQFFGESVFFSFLSLAIAIVLARLMLPYFNSLAGGELSLSIFGGLWTAPGLVLFALLVGLAAGSYPALLLSSFRPALVLKSRLGAGGSGAAFRRALVVLQFAISICLIIGTGLIIDQLRYMKKSDLGFDMEQVVVIPVMDRSLIRSVGAFKEVIAGGAGVLGVAASSHVPGGISSGGSFVPEGFAEGRAQMMNSQYIDDEYIGAMGMELAAGRNFSKDFPADTAGTILINEAAAREIGWDDPIGKKIRFSGDETRTPFTVVGVVKDFHYKSLHMRVEPLIIFRDPNYMRNVFVRIKPDDIPATLAFLGEKWAAFDPARPFEYTFLDESFDLQYRAEEKLERIFFAFTLLGIFIACLGLFGLASFAAEQRTREIGIRKVLGASISSIVALLSRQFTVWVLAANLVAWPVAWFALGKWLENFAYHTEIRWPIFIVSGGLALVIALATVSFQAVKAARSNPVEVIRYE